MSRLIDADALMDALGIAVECKDCSRNGTFGCKEDSAFVYACEAITDAPTIDPVKRGKWIIHPEVKNIYGGTYIECSECGEKYVVQYIEDEKFCRNCGAKMDEVTE